MILTGGLPFHQRQGTRMIDILLLTEGESARSFELGLALDRTVPMQTAQAMITPDADTRCRERPASHRIGGLALSSGCDQSAFDFSGSEPGRRGCRDRAPVWKPTWKAGKVSCAAREILCGPDRQFAGRTAAGRSHRRGFGRVRFRSRRAHHFADCIQLAESAGRAQFCGLRRFQSITFRLQTTTVAPVRSSGVDSAVRRRRL